MILPDEQTLDHVALRSITSPGHGMKLGNRVEMCGQLMEVVHCDHQGFTLMPVSEPRDFQRWAVLLIAALIVFTFWATLIAVATAAYRDAKADRAAEMPSSVPAENPELMLYHEFRLENLPPVGAK
jgi:hypothetical protein